VHSLGRSEGHRIGPADAVTLTRATLACAVAALVAEAFVHRAAVPALVTLAVAALVLDGVDGWVARRTRTASPFGARFDGEIDALLILVLSVYVAQSLGWWVLSIGAARYLFALAGRLLPWLRRPLPPRYWRKVVAATQGVVLTVAAAGILPRPLTYAALAVALLLLAESFGRDVLWTWRRRVDAAEPAHQPGRTRVVVTNTAAVVVVWVALVAPNQAHGFTPGELLRVPVELLVLAGLALVLPVVARQTVAVVVGVLLAVLTVVKALDIGFFAALDRPFNPVTDRGYLDSVVGLVQDSVGSVAAVAAVVVAVLAVLALVVVMPVSLARLTGLVATHPRQSMHVVGGLAVVWVLSAVSGLQVGSGAPVASTSASHLAAGQVRAITAGLQDREQFDAAARVDRFDDTADTGLLSGLRGKDVLLVFVESYGRVALEGSPSSPRLRAMLDASTRRLQASGYSSRSAYLTSPTFGGLSWLAHATLQSGLWVDNEPRYEQLLAGDRMTLSRAFGDEGWRTVAVTPTNDERWPEGERFYDLDRVYYKWDFGYRGPMFGFSRMPDQYALQVFHAQELAPRRRPPVMAEVDLASSHAPWAPVPRLLDWGELGDGSLFEEERRRAQSRSEAWSDRAGIEATYAHSIRYSLRTLISFIEQYGDEDLVLVVLGDHQPATIVTGHGASHDVPVTVVAKDPGVIDRISGWDWQPGLRPEAEAPVWPMNAFRDRFLAAFTPPSTPIAASGTSDTDPGEKP
jgi:phosphatidylglycerophosphate synthase